MCSTCSAFIRRATLLITVGRRLKSSSDQNVVCNSCICIQTPIARLCTRTRCRGLCSSCLPTGDSSSVCAGTIGSSVLQLLSKRSETVRFCLRELDIMTHLDHGIRICSTPASISVLPWSLYFLYWQSGTPGFSTHGSLSR